MKKGMLPVYVAVVALALAFAVPVLADDDDDNTVKHIEIGDEGVTITDEEGDTMELDWDEAIGIETIGEDVVRIGNDVHVPEGQVVEGDAVAIMGDVRVDGYVEGDAVAVGGSLIVGPRGRIDGDGVSVGGSVEKEGGVIRGETVSVGFGSWNHGPGFMMSSFFSAGRRFVLLIMWLVIVIVLGALLIAVVRRPVDIVSDRVRKEAFFNGLIGLLVWALFIPVLVLLVVTIIGIPIAILLPFVFAIMMLLGFIGVAAATGGKFVPDTNGGSYKSMAIGVIMLYALVILGALLRMGPGPMHFAGSVIGFIGWAIVFVAVTVGLGAVITSRFGTREKQPKAVPATASLPGSPPGEPAA
ncbi:MAG: hypothetical protein PVF95_10210 [bacterium]|jgi:hypothetical protein